MNMLVLFISPDSKRGFPAFLSNEIKSIFLNNFNTFAIVYDNKEIVYEIPEDMVNNRKIVAILIADTEDTFPTGINGILENAGELFICYHANADNKATHRGFFKENDEKSETEASHMTNSIYHVFAQWLKKENRGNLLDIIKRFFPNKKLEASLKFLHECLAGKPAELDILTKGEFTEEDFGDKDTKGSIRNLYKKIEGKKNSEYREALRVLRDAVLKKTGID